MLVLLQFPFADLRPLASPAGKPVGPDWGSPPLSNLPGFVRGFGGLRKRSPASAAAGGTWPGEAWFARAAAGIRLPQLTTAHFASAGVKLPPKHVVRRVFSDGEVLWRLEVGVGLNLREPLSAQQALQTVTDLLALPVRVRSKNHWGPFGALLKQGGAFEDALTKASSPQRSAPANGLGLKRGRPMVLIESTATTHAPQLVERLSVAPGSLHLKFGGDDPASRIDVDVVTLRVSNYEMPLVWLRSARRDPSAELTALRVNLMRLHAEREVLTTVLRALNQGQLGEPSRAFEQYQAAAEKRLLDERRDGIDQSALRYVFSVYDQFTTVELESLRTRLAKLRQTRERTMRLVQTYASADGRTTIVVTESEGAIQVTNNTVNVSGSNYGQINVAGTFVNNGTIIAGAADAKLKSAMEDLNKLAEQLAAKLPDVGDKEVVANKTQALVREAAAKKPDTDILKITGKGLVEAAKAVAEMAAPIATAVGAVLGIFGVVL
jgi:hypothetical protein